MPALNELPTIEPLVVKGSKEAVNPMNLKQANWINCTRTEPGLVLITRAGLESMQEAFFPGRLLRKEGVRARDPWGEASIGSKKWKDDLRRKRVEGKQGDFTERQGWRSTKESLYKPYCQNGEGLQNRAGCPTIPQETRPRPKRSEQ